MPHSLPSPALITSLAPNEVFVFGSNRSGFHGAGAAGYACRGTAENTWRTDEWFLKAMKAPVGSPDRVGKWAVYGVGRGWQQGREGMSYAIQTIEKPGMKRSTSRDNIEDQFIRLFVFALEHPEWQFLMTPVGAGLSGYTAAEMAFTLRTASTQWGFRFSGGIPINVIAPTNLYEGINWRQA